MVLYYFGLCLSFVVFWVSYLGLFGCLGLCVWWISCLICLRVFCYLISYLWLLFRWLVGWIVFDCGWLCLVIWFTVCWLLGRCLDGCFVTLVIVLVLRADFVGFNSVAYLFWFLFIYFY